MVPAHWGTLRPRVLSVQSKVRIFKNTCTYHDIHKFKILHLTENKINHLTIK